MSAVAERTSVALPTVPISFWLLWVRLVLLPSVLTLLKLPCASIV